MTAMLTDAMSDVYRVVGIKLTIDNKLRIQHLACDILHGRFYILLLP